MSWGTCYRGSNNIHAGFPALMSDGQWATNWEPACTINNEIKREVGITNNYEYRQFLINNADKVVIKNQREACGQCCSCMNQFENTNVIQQPNKYIFKSCADKTQPFGYQHSDLKNLYTSAQSLQSRLSAPIMTQSQMLNLPNWN